MFLYLGMQTMRFQKHIGAQTPEFSVETFLAKDDVFFDRLAAAWSQRFRLEVFSVVPGHFLFYPETGFFQFPTFEKSDGCRTGITISFALPITPIIFIGAISPSADIDRIRQDPNVSAFSVGLKEHCNKIVVPHEVAAKHEGDDALINHIRAMRASVVEKMTAVHKIRSLAAEMYEKVGFKLGPLHGT